MHFVYNPSGDFLPPDKKELEQEYKKAMMEHFSVRFNNLYCITNMPISRFASWLKRNNKSNNYLLLLRNSFNPQTVNSLMCRDTISVNWLGEVFDCGFNQMLNLPTYKNKRSVKVWYIDPKEFQNTTIRTQSHCFGCTACTGSSCGGALVE